jgi:hypothetical protein
MWLIFLADKPREFDPREAAQWKLGEIVGFYSFWAGAFNLALLGILVWAARWWADSGHKMNSGTTPGRILSGVFWLGVLGAMVFTGILACERLNFGLAHDEDLGARRAIVGEYKLAEDGSVLPPKLKLQNTSSTIASRQTTFSTACWQEARGRLGVCLRNPRAGISANGSFAFRLGWPESSRYWPSPYSLPG